ncbi:MAG: Gldg family protein [Planctomycetes bacterium]|nr:Gldg family protein [Planctomycetota bacterium]
MGLAFIQILILDVAFLALCVLAISPLIAYKKAAYAVLKRNFVGYFSNPTGYVFLCIFVLLTSFAAFWPHEFFTANLANLDQLNQVLPLIMLVFIPAITMSIWSEERRQGTDELLLTLPADDFDIVIGKYLAAAAIFTASLMFSQFSNYMVLASLSMGDLDTGLFFTTYLGYWLVGLAMLAIGMIASFLTSNMTVGFILGAAFNAPLAFAASAELIIPSPAVARNISFWSLASNFDDLSRGVLSISSFFYFSLVVAVGLYISMVLIGSRHWSGRGGPWMFLHFVGRALALVLILVFGLNFFTDHDLIRYDATAGQVSSLSPKTKEIIRNLNPDHPIVIDAFVSTNVPEAYVQTKFNLLSLLKEFDAMSGGKIKVNLHDNLEPFSEEAALAEDRFDILPTMVRTRSRGAFKDEEVILGAAFNCGLEKVVVPFFDYGIPVEYELTRSIGTVAEGERKKVGIVRTDAQLYGGFSFAGGMPRQIPRQEIIVELEKQYDVEEIDPTSPIEEGKYDVMIVVQPSSLGPQELPNVVAAVKNGVPTAIFEDPAPIFLSSAPGTGEPKQAPGGGMFGQGGQQPQPKGNIRELWAAIGIEPPGEPNFQGGFNPDVAWQRYNPYQKLQIQGIPDSWVFASIESPGADNAINSEDPITAGLNEILLPVPGVIVPASNSELKITPLVKTGDFAGRMRYEQYRNNQQDPARLQGAQGDPTGEQILAARIQGVGSADESENDEAADSNRDEGNSDNASTPVNVVYIADIDLMMSAFMRIRARPDDDEEMNWRFENVNFLLNIVDSLSGDDEYVEIRRRKPYHTTLKKVEEKVRSQRDAEFRNRIDYEEKFNDEIKKIEEENQKLNKELDDELEELQKRQREGGDVSSADVLAKIQLRSIKEQELTQKLGVKREQMQRERDDRIEEARRQTDLKILEIQNFYKFLAVALPPIPPLLVGLIVFVSRRLREREGIAKSRLRS